MSTGIVSLLWVLCSSGQATQQTTATMAAWREALELDLPSEVLERGPALVAAGGALAQEGEALALVARALFDTGREGEAEALLSPARPSEATRSYLELERVREWIELDQLERAIAALDTGAANASGPDGRPRRTAPRFAERPQSWFLLGKALSRAGREEEAAPFLQHYLELEPFGPGAYAALHMLAQTAIARGDGAAAAQLSERRRRVGEWREYWRTRCGQVRDKPEEPLPRLGLAQLWLSIGEHAQAEEVLKELVSRVPGYAPGWFHLGEAQRARGDLPAARLAYTRALDLDPDHALARYNRAVLLLAIGERAGARADLEALVAGPHASEPKLAAAHLLLARLLLGAGEASAATERYARYRVLGGTEPLEPPTPGR